MKPLAPLHPEPLPPYTAVDLLDTDSLLTPPERALRDQVRTWVDARLMPIITECHFAGRFPSELVTLPKDAILPGSAGVKSPLMCLNQARYGIVWGARSPQAPRRQWHPRRMAQHAAHGESRVGVHV